MALPSSGAISLGQVNTELGLSATASINMGSTVVRTLFGIASGAISMSNGYGKSNVFSLTLSTNQQQINLRTLAVAAGWNQSVAVVVTVNAGVYIWSDSLSVPAMTIDGSWPGGIKVVNNGYIMGKGGTGGGAISGNSQIAALAGFTAISIAVAVTIDNTNASAYIGGGGGGGGGFSSNVTNGVGVGGGGGAGGAPGGRTTYIAVAGSGGAVGSAGGNGSTTGQDASGAGGGRIFPGVGGAGGAITDNILGGTAAGQGGGAGGGGGASKYVSKFSLSGAAGGGGGWGAAGGNGSANFQVAGSGGSGSAAGGSVGTDYLGAAGGKAVALNGFTVTWVSSNTTRVYGAVS